eukprot:6436266-Amphidinium_carterae.1
MLSAKKVRGRDALRIQSLYLDALDLQAVIRLMSCWDQGSVLYFRRHCGSLHGAINSAMSLVQSSSQQPQHAGFASS